MNSMEETKGRQTTDAMLVDMVSSLCEVDKGAILSTCAKWHIVQARWFYWYAIRYIRHDTFVLMAERMPNYTKDGIRKGVEKMARMVAKDATWRRRWYDLRQRAGITNDDNKPHEITICVPKEISEQVVIKIKNT